jgi:transposase InsO family protein
MPWKESSVMDERMRFVIRLKDGESMASLCREFGISRKTGYKILDRYEQCGVEGLSDRARRPHRYANQLPAPVEAAIVAAKREKPHWGARKIHERLLRRLPSEVKVPARSTIHAILDRYGLVARASRPRTRAEGTPLSAGLNPNELWCTDYKGEFQLGNKRYCYPLTVTDYASRYLLLCEAMESNQEQPAFLAFERLFRERGLPQAIRSDNGVPFASPNGLFNLSKLSEVYTASVRPYNGIPDPYYPFHDKTVVVTNCGRLCFYRKKINLSSSLAGQAVGIKEVDDGIWLVSFMNYDLGYVDLEEKTLQPLENPFGPKV